MTTYHATTWQSFSTLTTTLIISITTKVRKQKDLNIIKISDLVIYLHLLSKLTSLPKSGNVQKAQFLRMFLKHAKKRLKRSYTGLIGPFSQLKSSEEIVLGKSDSLKIMFLIFSQVKYSGFKM